MTLHNHSRTCWLTTPLGFENEPSTWSIQGHGRVNALSPPTPTHPHPHYTTKDQKYDAERHLPADTATFASRMAQARAKPRRRSLHCGAEWSLSCDAHTRTR